MSEEYIKREDALAVLERLRDKCGNDEMAFALNWAGSIVKNIPAADAVERPRWIPVTEALPIGGDDSGAICENVCLLMDDGTVSCGWMNGITKKVYYLNARDDAVLKAPITRVTHWMPLPEPPKEVNT